VSRTDFLSVPVESIDPDLHHVGMASRRWEHRDFCLVKYPTPRTQVAPSEPGQHFQVNPIKIRSAIGVTETVCVVVRHSPSGRSWDALGAAGFFDAIAPNAPRADIDFARHHPDALLFPDMDSAVRAAVVVLRAEIRAEVRQSRETDIPSRRRVGGTIGSLHNID
jgi:hypothetical protein